MRSSKIIELRELLAAKFPAASLKSRRCLTTGIKRIDAALHGGVPFGGMTEVVSPLDSAGSGTVIAALIDAAKVASRPLALVDGGNSFDPDGLQNEQLSSLLWVRCAGAKQAVQVADLLLRDGNLPLIVLDLMTCPLRDVQAIPSSSWYRLQRVTGENGSAALIFTPAAVVTGAVCTLRLNRRFELPALDLLRDELTASLYVETIHRRVASFTDGQQPSDKRRLWLIRSPCQTDESHFRSGLLPCTPFSFCPILSCSARCAPYPSWLPPRLS